MVKITEVEKGSLAEAAGLSVGDILVAINKNAINDVLDYRFYLAERKIKIEYERDGRRRRVKIKKDEYDDIGLGFETPLMDEKQRCKNGCIFCFIDQNPKGLRESLYFKDDDSRLSFIHGNYITLTNMNDADVERIVKMRFSPINVSVHTTNPDLRVKMMKNKRAGEVLRYLDAFKDAGLSMCGQIVLCRGINDGEELVRSMKDLSRLFPNMGSVSVVPAGLTAHREGLYPLADFTKDEALAIVDAVNTFGDETKRVHGSRMFFAADELYLKAGLPVPDEDYYEGYPQLENGVGMMRSFISECEWALDSAEKTECAEHRSVGVVTSAASYAMMCEIATRVCTRYPEMSIKVYKIKNKFFGESITVSGLITGRDICEQLSGVEPMDELVIPRNALRHGEETFLCGMTVSELSDRLGVKVSIGEADGGAFVDALLGRA